MITYKELINCCYDIIIEIDKNNNNVDITTSLLSDDCIVAYLGKYGRIWFEPNGFISEFEVFAQIRNYIPDLHMQSDVGLVEGTPIFTIDNVENLICDVYLDDKNVLVVFYKELKFDFVIKSNKLIFFLQNKSLIAIMSNFE